VTTSILTVQTSTSPLALSVARMTAFLGSGAKGAMEDISGSRRSVEKAVRKEKWSCSGLAPLTPGHGDPSPCKRQVINSRLEQ